MPTSIVLPLASLVLLAPSAGFRPESSALEVFDSAAALLREHHPHHDRRLPGESFERALAALRATLDADSSDTALALAILGSVHLVAEGHTRLDVGEAPPFDIEYPLRFEVEGAELRVRALHGLHADGLLGARVVALGAAPVADAVERLLPYCTGDNEHHALELVVPRLLRSPRIAMELGLADEDGFLDLALESLDGAPLELELVPGPRLSRDDPDWIEWEVPVGPDAPLYLRDPSAFHWVTTLPDADAVYAQYNQVNNGEPSTADFADAIVRALDTSGAQRLVVDVRRNGGGNNFQNAPILHALLKHDVNRPGRLFVLIGPNTFSAAMNFCGWLERETHAIFVGEPTGAPPNMAGDTQPHGLDRAGWVLHISAWPWQESMPWDRRLYIRPRVEARTTWPDLLAGRDPALEAALGFDRPELVERLMQSAPRTHYEDPWQAPAVDAGQRWPRR